MIVLTRKLKNAVEKVKPGMEYHLKQININGDKRGCSGFIRNPQNNSIVYVNTEEIKCMGQDKRYMYRYANNLNDYTGYRNRWIDSLEGLVQEICNLLQTPVNEIRDIK